MANDMVEYIIYRLPIWSEESLSLEQIAKEFDINYKIDATQEEIAEAIYEVIKKGE